MTTEKNRRIILIAYVFPPYPGIGGRRWAKLSKYLARLGYEVHVITAKNPFNETSTWSKDVESNDKIHLHVLPARYPSVLNGKIVNVFDKILYRFWTLILKISVKGTIYDRAVFWRSSVNRTVDELMNKYKFDAVVATGAPFSVLFYAVQLKKKYHDLKVITDLRDPWSWNTHAYGFGYLSQKRASYELMMEKEVMRNSDVVTVPVSNMISKLLELYPECAGKINLLPHGYDTDEIKPSPKSKSDKIRMIFYGSLYQSIEGFVALIAKVLAEKCDEVDLDIYSDSKRYQEIFKAAGAGSNVTYFDPLPSEELFKLFVNYDYVLLIHPDYGRDNVGTKFYEIIASHTPIIYVGNSGIAASFVEDNRVGMWLRPESVEEQLRTVLDKQFVFNYNFEFDTSQLTFARIAESFGHNFLDR